MADVGGNVSTEHKEEGGEEEEEEEEEADPFTQCKGIPLYHFSMINDVQRAQAFFCKP